MTDVSIASLLKSEIPDAIIMGIEKALSERSYQTVEAILPHIDSANQEVSRKARLAAREMLLTLLLAAPYRIPHDKFVFFSRILKKISPEISSEISKEISLPQSSWRSVKLKLLTAIDTEDAAKILNGAHFDPDPRLRATAVKLYRELNPSDVQTRIMKFLSDNDPRVVSNALESLESMRNPNLVGTFARFRNSSDPRIRSVVIRTLCMLGEKDLQDDIKSLVENGSEKAHSALAWLLPSIPTVIADPLPILEKLAKSGSSVITSAAVNSLKRIGSSAAQSILSNMHDLEKLRKEDEAREKLHNAMFEKEGHKRAIIVRQSAPFITKGAIGTILPFISDPSPKVAVAAIEAINRSPEKAIAEINSRKLIASTDPRIRATAIKSMAFSGKINVFAEISKIIADPKDKMRAVGMSLIEELGSSDLSLCGLLQHGITDKSRLVRRMAKKAQKKIMADYYAGKRTVNEHIIEEARKTTPQKDGSTSLPREILHQKVASVLKIKPTEISRHTRIIAETTLCKITTDSFGMEIIIFPERDALDLFLYYCENIRTGTTADWGAVSENALTVLQNITYLSQKHGRMVDNKTAFPLKELEHTDLPKNFSIHNAVLELEKIGICESLKEEKDNLLLFKRDKVQKFINTLKWLPQFEKILGGR